MTMDGIQLLANRPSLVRICWSVIRCLLPAMLVLAGCGGEREAVSVPAPEAEAPEDDLDHARAEAEEDTVELPWVHRPDVWARREAHRLRATLDAPPRAGLGEEITFRLTISNRTPEPAVFLVRGALRLPPGELPGADPPRHEDAYLWSYVHIEDEEGTRIRTLPVDAPPAAIGMMFQLMPQDTLLFHHRWDGRDDERREVSPGTYRAHGELVTEPSPVRSRRITVEILP